MDVASSVADMTSQFYFFSIFRILRAKLSARSSSRLTKILQIFDRAYPKIVFSRGSLFDLSRHVAFLCRHCNLAFSPFFNCTR